MTLEEARIAGQTDPRFNRVLSVFAIMQKVDGTYTYGLEDTSLPKSKEEAQTCPKTVERWQNTAFSGWLQLYL